VEGKEMMMVNLILFIVFVGLLVAVAGAMIDFSRRQKGGK
jgi:hypothetical protein